VSDLLFPTYRIEPGEPVTLAVRRSISHELLVRDSPSLCLQHAARDLQDQVGMRLVDAIWRAGGIATVALDFTSNDSWDVLTRDLTLRARMRPADRLQHITRVTQPHLEYFPADWVCLYCGWLNDGLKHPRTCPHCGGTKYLDWREKAL